MPKIWQRNDEKIAKYHAKRMPEIHVDPRCTDDGRTFAIGNNLLA